MLPAQYQPKWMQGARLTIITVLSAIVVASTKIEIPLLSQLLCFLWNLVFNGCIPETLQGWISVFLAWCAMALTVQDQMEKNAKGIPTVFNSIPKQKAA